MVSIVEKIGGNIITSYYLLQKIFASSKGGDYIHGKYFKENLSI